MSNALVMELDSLMRDQIDMIDRAIERARADDVMDISALNVQIDKICARAGKLDEQSAQQIGERMAEMISKLESLAAELNALQDRRGGR